MEQTKKEINVTLRNYCTRCKTQTLVDKINRQKHAKRCLKNKERVVLYCAYCKNELINVKQY